MQQFMRKFEQLNGEMAKITLNHCLFDKQVFYCNKLQTINDDNRVGIVIKDREIFVYKHDIKVAEVCDNVYKIADDRLTIIVELHK